MNNAYDTIGREAEKRNDYDKIYVDFGVAAQWSAYRMQQEHFEEKRREQERKAEEIRRAIEEKAKLERLRQKRREIAERERIAAAKRREDNEKAARERINNEKERNSLEQAELYRQQQAERATFVLAVQDEQERLAANTTTKSSRMTIQQQASWIKQEASLSIFPYAKQSTQAGGVPTRTHKKFMGWLARTEKLLSFLEELVIVSELRWGVAQLDDMLRTISEKENVHFPTTVRDRAALLLKKWDAIKWQGRGIL